MAHPLLLDLLSALAVLAPPPDPSQAEPSRWSAAFQSTSVWQAKPAFAAAYSGPKSLSPQAESGYTFSATLFLGVRPWPGGELFVDPELVQGRPLSNLSGLAGVPNGEAQDPDAAGPELHRARLFLRQTFALGGQTGRTEPGPNQFGGEVASRRLVLTAGNFSANDVFYGSALAHDPRTQFLNASLTAYGAFDCAGDGWGLALELDLDDWALRGGRFASAADLDRLSSARDLLARGMDAVEIEHGHQLWGRRGTLRLSGFRSQGSMGSFGEAMQAVALGGGPPDVATVRRQQVKFGLGVTWEQELSSQAAFFVRYSWNDGRTETVAFAEIERSFAAGVSLGGLLWRRPGDTLAVAWVENGLSPAHQRYLEARGVGPSLGDGRLRYQPERIAEAYYSFQVSQGLWLGLDAQRIWNPAYNADRGPVNVLGFRVHLER